MLMASILTSEPIEYQNVPNLEDVSLAIHLLEQFGAQDAVIGGRVLRAVLQEDRDAVAGLDAHALQPPRDGKRLALPNARIMIHQGSAGTRGAPSDMEIQLREVLALTRRMGEIIAHHSGRPVDDVMRDIDRDYFMTPDEAIGYGLIDAVISPWTGLLAAAGAAA